jgi:hypothetical protein
MHVAALSIVFPTNSKIHITCRHLADMDYFVLCVLSANLQAHVSQHAEWDAADGVEEHDCLDRVVSASV